MLLTKLAVKFIIKIKKDLDKLNNLKNFKANKFNSKTKSVINPVTKLDLNVEKFLRLKIK